MRKRIRGAIAVSLVLSGCAAIAPTVTSDVEASLVNALTNALAPGVNTAIAQAVTDSQGAINFLNYSLPWAQDAIDKLGPLFKVPAATITKIDAAIVIAEADLKNPPTSVGAAVAEAVNTFNEVKAALGISTSAASVRRS